MRELGVLVISHGSRNSDWVRLVDDAAADVRMPQGVPLECSFLELVNGRLIQDGINRLEGKGITDILVIPLFVSSGSTHVNEIGYALGAYPQADFDTELKPFAVQATIHYDKPLDDDPEMARQLLDNLQPLSEDPQREIVLIIAHGSKHEGFHARWRKELDSLAGQLRKLGDFCLVEGAMLSPDQVSPRLQAYETRFPGYPILVAPLFLSEGFFTKDLIPQRLRGFACRYNGRTLLPGPMVSRWLEQRIQTFVTNIDLEDSGECI